MNSMPIHLRWSRVSDYYGMFWDLSMIKVNGRIEIVAFQVNSGNQIEFCGALVESDFGRAAGRLSRMNNLKEERLKSVYL